MVSLSYSFIHIIPDKTNNTLNIIDSGIGMTKAVATPKQIRDLMKVDGLTNYEVKSHLQKYILHTKRPATPVVTNGGENPQQQQFMVVEGIWVPSHDTTNNRVYVRWRFNLHRWEREVAGAANRRQHLLHTHHTVFLYHR